MEREGEPPGARRAPTPHAACAAPQDKTKSQGADNSRPLSRKVTDACSSISLRCHSLLASIEVEIPGFVHRGLQEQGTTRRLSSLRRAPRSRTVTELRRLTVR